MSLVQILALGLPCILLCVLAQKIINISLRPYFSKLKHLPGPKVRSCLLMPIFY